MLNAGKQTCQQLAERHNYLRHYCRNLSLRSRGPHKNRSELHVLAEYWRGVTIHYNTSRSAGTAANIQDSAIGIPQAAMAGRHGGLIYTLAQPAGVQFFQQKELIF